MDVISVKISIETAAFKVKCVAEENPQAQIIKQAIEIFLNK